MSKTLENLVRAFVGECIAINRYKLYAKVARDEGYVYVARVFLETAENEFEHAETIFKFIQKLRNDGIVNVSLNVSLTLGSTVENLRSAVEGERYENTEMYPEFARVAEEEGFNEISSRLKAIANAEKHHEMRYNKILRALGSGEYFKRDVEIEWVCLECGYVHVGTEPPEVCPSCGHPKSYYVARDMLTL